MYYRILIISVIVVILLVLLILPVHFPFSITVPGKILSSKEWVLSKGPDGRLISTLIDNKEGITRTYTISQIEGGDAGKFYFKPSVKALNYVEQGDTVGQFYSNEVHRQFVRLEGELESALSSLSLYQTGEKLSVIREARQRLELANKKAEEQQKILNRSQRLYEQNLISQEEFEIVEAELQLAEINKKISQSQYEAASTGAKPEQIAFLKTNIRMLQSELKVLEERLKSYTVIAPFCGYVNRNFTGDTLAVLSDTSTFILIMPVKVNDRKHITEHKPVEIQSLSEFDPVQGKINHIDKTVHIVSGQQVVYATALLEGKFQDIFPGLVTSCTISCNPLTPLQYIKENLNSINVQ